MRTTIALIFAITLVACGEGESHAAAKGADTAVKTAAPARPVQPAMTIAQLPDFTECDTASLGPNPRTFSTALFSVDVPGDARDSLSADSAGTTVLCADGCRVGIRAERDTAGTGAEGRVLDLMREQARIDSANKAAGPRGIMEFDEIDGPPMRLKAAGGTGFVIDDDCGDCASRSILFSRPGWIATFSSSYDDDQKDVWRKDCEMIAMARTFRWTARGAP